MAVDYGSVADWLAAAGGLASVTVACWIALDERRRRIAAEDEATAARLARRNDVVLRAMEELLSVIDATGDGFYESVGAPFEWAVWQTKIRSSVGILQGLRSSVHDDAETSLALTQAIRASVEAARLDVANVVANIPVLKQLEAAMERLSKLG